VLFIQKATPAPQRPKAKLTLKDKQNILQFALIFDIIKTDVTLRR
jgi:hypothetical protein